MRIMGVIVALIATRVAVGVALAAWGEPLCVDDTFRVFYAAWWAEHPGFASHLVWLPGYSWLYGSAVGLTASLFWAPKLLTLFFQCATGALLAFGWPEKRSVCWASAAFVWFHPLAFSLGSAPLSESAAVFFVMAAWLGIERAKSSVAAWLTSAIALFLACSFRYEFWILTPFFAWKLWKLGTLSIFVRVAVALLPMGFPFIWILYAFLMEGTWLSFLTGIADDHFGPSSLGQLFTLEGTASLVLWCVVFCAYSLKSRSYKFEDLLSLLLMLFVLLLVLRHSLPSQYASRLFYAPSMLLAPTFGRLWADARWRCSAILGVSSAVGLFAAWTHPSGNDVEAQQAGHLLAEMLDRDPDAHALISLHMPENTAVFVFTDRLKQVLLDGMGRHCAPDFFHQRPEDPECPVLPQISYALLWRGGLEERIAMQAGFESLASFPHWQLFRVMGVYGRD